MKQFRVGVIGCGNIFPMHAASLGHIKAVKIVAICDKIPSKAKKTAKKYRCKYYTNYKKMLDEESLDSVHILTPHYLHPEMAIEAAKRKINVLCEKPIAINPKDASRMIKICRKNRVKLGVISQNRYNPGAQLAKKCVSNGSLGKIKGVKLIVSYHKPKGYYTKSDWKGTLDKEGGGVLIDQSIHFIDVLNWIINDRVEYVEAHIANRMHPEVKVEDLAEGLIKYKKGAYICFYLINYYPYDDHTEIELDCEKGRVKIVKNSARIDFYSGKALKAAPKKGQYIDYGKGVKDYWGFCHSIQIKEFYNALQTGRNPEITGQNGLETLNIVWNIYKSAKLQRRICF
ncbi:MAG: Gfo/Idh/MocA family oxidoreductase [Candidatus Omnitrophica bacterium]|nr:Gfo/Idh/MocA family oxidoreductase [Candidatus Omnitrophota bacterium]